MPPLDPTNPVNALYLQGAGAPTYEDLASKARTLFPGGASYQPLIDKYRTQEQEALDRVKSPGQGSMTEGVAGALISALPALFGAAIGGSKGAALGAMQGPQYSDLFFKDRLADRKYDYDVAKEELKGTRDKLDDYTRMQAEADRKQAEALFNLDKDYRKSQDEAALRREQMSQTKAYQDEQLRLSNERNKIEKDKQDKKQDESPKLQPSSVEDIRADQAQLSLLDKNYDFDPNISFKGKRGEEIKKAVNDRILNDKLTQRVFQFINDVGPVMTDIMTDPVKKKQANDLKNDLLGLYRDRPEARQGFTEKEAARLISGTPGVSFATLADTDVSWLEALAKSPILNMSKGDALNLLAESYQRTKGYIAKDEAKLGLHYNTPDPGASPDEWMKARDEARSRQLGEHQTRQLSLIKGVDDEWKNLWSNKATQSTSAATSPSTGPVPTASPQTSPTPPQIDKARVYQLTMKYQSGQALSQDDLDYLDLADKVLLGGK